jgi:hypothetical protein
MYRWFQHSLVAEDDPQKRHQPLFGPDKSAGFEWHIGGKRINKPHRALQTQSTKRVTGEEMNFSGTTTKNHIDSFRRAQLFASIV